MNITLQTHRPKLPQINPAYNFTDDWRSYANTPGHAMQIETGKYKGRIYIAANHSEGRYPKMNQWIILPMAFIPMTMVKPFT
ncbi:MAG: hypothetical protein IPP81_09965 [Chitinophagaceae bacterium]|nr:hypothetical protein [Chitinophagaceae bacterium]